MKKRILGLALTLALALTLVPWPALAMDPPEDVGALNVNLTGGKAEITDPKCADAFLATMAALGDLADYTYGDPDGLDLDRNGTSDVLVSVVGDGLLLENGSSASVFGAYTLTLDEAAAKRVADAGAPAFYSSINFKLPPGGDEYDDYVPGVVKSDTLDLSKGLESRPVEDFWAVINSLLAAAYSGVINMTEQDTDVYLYDIDKDGSDDILGTVTPDHKTTTLQLLADNSLTADRVITITPAGIAYAKQIHSPCYCEELTIKVPAPAQTNPFSDVKEADYFYEAVLWAVENGVTSGTSPNTFAPDAVCSRAEVVTFLWRAVHEPRAKTAANPFTDVKPTDYYYQAVLWAYENGITSGSTATTFSPKDPCGRAQVVTFIFRTMRASIPEEQNNPFTDVKPTDYFYGPVLWAVAAGVTSGTSPTTFSPNANCTRAQVVTFLFRALGGTWTYWESTP